MRVTANTFPNSLVDQLNLLASRQYRLQNQAATGQRIQTPDDDPAAMRRVMNLQTESQSLTQYQSNIAALQEQAGASFDAMNALKKISDRAGEIATLADGTKSPQELQTYATEVTQLIQQAVQLANSQSQGSYLFGGTLTNQPPFTLSTDGNGAVTGVTYQGNTTITEVEIEQDSTFSALSPGANTTGSGPRGLISDSRTGADFFNHLIALQNHLQAGDTATIAAADRPALSKDEDNLIYHLSNNGALQSRLDAASTIASSRASAVNGLVSNEADADMAQTLVRLNQTQTAYQAAIQSAASIMTTSLLDYLK